FKLGDGVQLFAITDPPGSYIYDWTPALHLSCGDCPNPVATPDSTINYEIRVEDMFGCVDSAAITLEMLEICDETALIVPTGFTPNGDGQNDVLRVLGDSEVLVFRIFNRWGEVVFETTDPAAGWNGTYNGELLNRDVFVYYVEGRCQFDGSVMIRTGDVTLIR
ncbi:MAG: gliding motility-associated C-terminal domain-containing protein, partial [Bacteroidota bacterium]